MLNPQRHRRSVESNPGDSQAVASVVLLLRDGESCSDMVAPLLRRAAGVNCRDGNGRTALSHACERGHLEAVKLLVRQGADPEFVDAWGNTALMYAAAGGHGHVVEFLVRAFKRLGCRLIGGRRWETLQPRWPLTRCISVLASPSLNTRGEPSAQLPHTLAPLGCEFEAEVDSLVQNVEALQVIDHAHLREVKNSLWPRRRQSLLSRKGTGHGGRPFSAVLTPKPPSCSQRLKGGPITSVFDEPLPVLDEKKRESASLFPAERAPSLQGILLTPDLSHRTPTARRLRECYYCKRYSLPATILRPTTPQRTVQLKKLQGPEASAVTPSITSVSPARRFFALSHRLLRRFTSPEFREAEAKAAERMPSSTTFPLLDSRHPEVDSKLRIDSISSIKCEFDLYCGISES